MTAIKNDTGTREDYFISLQFFREVMCSTKYTIEQKDNSYANLCQDYFRCAVNENDRIHFVAITDEWERRRFYEMGKEAQ